ncbi:hypothetical protein TNCV_2681421 [Trichonephila clavipes]|uniref:Uncharacterized protein n=1 Tax=Trichonephila clavipes TaxID=2585209 RepID=A0A8X6VGD1_TRICX|nr:hypothetical protein TNCV_2681421 [Trichonephila clavipes]
MTTRYQQEVFTTGRMNGKLEKWVSLTNVEEEFGFDRVLFEEFEKVSYKGVRMVGLGSVANRPGRGAYRNIRTEENVETEDEDE